MLYHGGWDTHVIPAFGRDHCEFKVNLGYTVVQGQPSGLHGDPVSRNQERNKDYFVTN